MTKAVAVKSWTLNTWTDGTKRSYPQGAQFPFTVGNSGGVTPGDGNSPPTYQDQMQNSRGFMTTADLTVHAALDASGWPTTDFQTLLTETQNYSIAPNWNSGGYACGFTSKGTGTETITPTGATVSGQSYNSGTKQVTFTLTPTVSASVFGFKVTGTTGGATNVFAMLPAYAANTPRNAGGSASNLYTTEYKNKLSAMPLQRNQIWCLCIWNLSTNSWSTHHSPTNSPVGSPGYTGGWRGSGTIGNGSEGYSVEDFVTLCNQTSSYLWQCNPYFDDGTYAGGAATYIVNNLTAEFSFYELGNEGWNTGDGGIGSAMLTISGQFIAANPGVIDYDGAFSTTASGTSGTNTITVTSVPATWAVNQTISSNSPGIPQPTGIQAISGTTVTLTQNLTANLTGASVASQNAAMVRRLWAKQHTAMAAQISAAVGSNYGTKANMVLCWQTGNTSNIAGMLAYIATKIGTVSSYIHYLAIAPYMTRNNSAIPSDGVNHINVNDTVANIQAQLTTNGTYRGYLAQMEQLLILALSYGLKGTLTYECGWETAGETTVAASLGAAIMDSGMGAVTTNYLTHSVYECGAQLANNTSFGVVNSNSVLDPNYGMSNDPNTFVTSGSPRFNALSAFQSSPPARARNVVAASGATIDLINYADNAVGLSSTYPNLGGKTVFTASKPTGGSGNPVHIHAPVAGTYSLSCTFANTASGTTTGLECNGATLAGVSVPNGTPTVALGTITLVQGENYAVIWATNQTGCIPKSLTFT